ncbi:membrane protein, partial [Salmonella enterica subsp. enterica serovar Senftenberg]
MPAIISLIYLMFSLLVFTKKITISNVLSAFLLFLSLYI